MLSTPEFKEFATTDVVPFMHVTSMFEGEPHPNMLEEMGGRGWPTFLVLDEAGEIVARDPEPSIDGFQSAIKTANEFKDLKTKFEGGAKELEGDVLLAELKLGRMDYEKAQAAFKSVQANEKVSAEKKAEIGKELINMEVGNVFMTARSEEDVTNGLTPLIKAKKVPTDPNLAANYWFFASMMAAKNGDKELMGRAVAAAKKLAADDDSFGRLVSAVEENAKQLEEGGDEPVEEEEVVEEDGDGGR